MKLYVARHFALVLLALAVFCMAGCTQSETARLLQAGAPQQIVIEQIQPMDYTHERFEITPDLTVRWTGLDPTDWSDEAEVLWVRERTITEPSYKAILDALAESDFATLPPELEKWQGADGPSQDITVVFEERAHSSGGYFPTKTNARFARVWEALGKAGTFDRDGYTQIQGGWEPHLP